MNKTNIEWTDYTWNPVTGCTKISQGCKFCYAETMNTRFGKGRKFIEVRIHPERLNEPLEKGKALHGKQVFTCDVSDLFHPEVPFNFIADVFTTIFKTPNTTYQVLTKRPDRALEFSEWVKSQGTIQDGREPWPLPNVWFGVSIEDQPTANLRIPLALQFPARVHFVSYEPALGPVDFKSIKDPRQHNALIPGAELEWFNAFHSSVYIKGIDWVIAGGESASAARPVNPLWMRSVRNQCRDAGVPFFFKQWGSYKYIEGFPFPVDDIGKARHYWANEQFVKITRKAPAEVLNRWPLAVRVGKKNSGNVLDGTIHIQFPEA